MKTFIAASRSLLPCEEIRICIDRGHEIIEQLQSVTDSHTLTVTEEDIRNAAIDYSQRINTPFRTQAVKAYMIGATEMRDNKISISSKK